MNSIDPNETKYRKQLINGISLLERLGIIDFNGHFSVRLDDGTILINTGASVRSKLDLNDFVIVGAFQRLQLTKEYSYETDPQKWTQNLYQKCQLAEALCRKLNSVNS